MEIEKISEIIKANVYNTPVNLSQTSFWIKPKVGEDKYIQKLPDDWDVLDTQRKVNYIVKSWLNPNLANALFLFLTNWMSEYSYEDSPNKDSNEGVRDFIYEMF
jgi:hypothetical protein